MGQPETDSAELDIIRDVIDRGKVGPAQMLVIVVALILNMLDGFDVTAMAFTVHAIGEELQIAPQHLGIVFSVALAGMMIGAMFIAPISDIIGRRKMILACVSVIGASMYLTGYSAALWQLVILRLVTGLGVGGMLASLAAITAEFTPVKFRSLAVVSVTAGYPLGAMVGGFLAAAIIPAYGWQSVFFAGGAATLLMVVAIHFLVPESLQYLSSSRPPNALARFNEVLARLGKAKVDSLPMLNAEKSRDKANVFSLLTRERRLKTITLWTTFFFCFICLYFLMSWIPKLVINAGFSETQGIYGSIAFSGGGVVGILVLGWISSRISLTNLIGSFLIAGAIAMIVFALSSGMNQLLFYLGLIGFLMNGGFTGLYAVAAKLYPTEVRSTGVGWAIGLGRFGAVAGPYIGGVLIARGVTMEVNFVIYAIPLFISGLLAFRLSVR